MFGFVWDHWQTASSFHLRANLLFVVCHCALEQHTTDFSIPIGSTFFTILWSLALYGSAFGSPNKHGLDSVDLHTNTFRPFAFYTDDVVIWEFVDLL